MDYFIKTKALIISILLIFLAGIESLANMASPFLPGTMAPSAFTSKYVVVLGEKITVVPENSFRYADYFIEYRIRVDKEGIRVPLLFYALDYEGEFTVSLDGKPIALKQIPSEFTQMAGQLLENFDYFYNDTTGNTQEIQMEYTSGNGILVNLKDLKYFETDLHLGEHVIRVAYKAASWTDKSNWVKQYTFRYALSPAKYWKSFENLSIEIDLRNCPKSIRTNLGDPTSGSMDSIAIWNFKNIPVDIFEIYCDPAISSTASFLIQTGPELLNLIFAIILIALHVGAIIVYRRKNPDTRFSWVMISGSIFIPLLVLIAYLLFFGLIDSLIGEHASKQHGYNFIVILLYPFITPVYWLIMWLVDRLYRRMVIKTKQMN